jgi:hypothetical protein
MRSAKISPSPAKRPNNQSRNKKKPILGLPKLQTSKTAIPILISSPASPVLIPSGRASAQPAAVRQARQTIHETVRKEEVHVEKDADSRATER